MLEVVGQGARASLGPEARRFSGRPRPTQRSTGWWSSAVGSGDLEFKVSVDDRGKQKPRATVINLVDANNRYAPCHLGLQGPVFVLGASVPVFPTRPNVPPDPRKQSCCLAPGWRPPGCRGARPPGEPESWVREEGHLLARSDIPPQPTAKGGQHQGLLIQPGDPYPVVCTRLDDLQSVGERLPTQPAPRRPRDPPLRRCR